MNSKQIAWWRMHNLGLTSEPFESPEDVVRWLGLVQSQEFGPAKWSIVHRTAGVDDAEMDRLFNEGRILRTHALRPTWHFVLPEDIRLVQQVTGPRVQVANGHMYRRQLDLDEVTLGRCNEIITDALAGGNHLTRKEIGELLGIHGIEATGQRLAYIMMNAELECVVCSGALKGKQQTYALVDERAPNARQYDDPDEALAVFVLRYFTSHGPATIKDLRAWSSLTITEIRRGIAMVESELEQFELDGLMYWFVHGPTGRRPSQPHVLLLQGYDEYVMGYLESRHVIDVVGRLESLHPDHVVATGIVVIDSQAFGHWKRTVKARSVDVEIFLLAPVDAAQTAALGAVANQFGEYIGLPANVKTNQIR